MISDSFTCRTLVRKNRVIPFLTLCYNIICSSAIEIFVVLKLFYAKRFLSRTCANKMEAIF